MVGMMDNMKDKARQAAGEHGDKIDEGLDRAGDLGKEKTPDQHDDQIDQGVERGKQAAGDVGR